MKEPSPRRRRERHGARLNPAAWLMLVAALAQVWLPVLATPAQIVRADGRIVVMCTAQGLQKLWLQDDGQLGEPQPTQNTTALCPVCAFGHAPALPTNLPPMALVRPHLSVPSAPAAVHFESPQRSAHRARAPPSA